MAGALRLSRIGSRHFRFDSGIHLIGYVFDPNQFVQFEIRALGLLGLSLGVEAGLDVIVPLSSKAAAHNPRPRGGW